MDESDWRLSNGGEYLHGLTLYWRAWTETRPGWDHDHCEMCFAKFASVDEDAETLRHGYTTSDEYRWICEECFADFREHYDWRIGTV
jgi:hypothetical protein